MKGLSTSKNFIQRLSTSQKQVLQQLIYVQKLTLPLDQDILRNLKIGTRAVTFVPSLFVEADVTDTLILGLETLVLGFETLFLGF